MKNLSPKEASEIPNSLDCISRQAAIYAIEKRMDDITCEEFAEGMSEAITEISLLPSALPEIIRCKDCKYRDENWRRVSVRWLPCMDIRVPSNWFCGSAERREDE